MAALIPQIKINVREANHIWKLTPVSAKLDAPLRSILGKQEFTNLQWLDQLF